MGLRGISLFCPLKLYPRASATIVGGKMDIFSIVFRRFSFAQTTGILAFASATRPTCSNVICLLTVNPLAALKADIGQCARLENKDCFRFHRSETVFCRVGSARPWSGSLLATSAVKAPPAPYIGSGSIRSRSSSTPFS